MKGNSTAQRQQPVHLLGFLLALSWLGMVVHNLLELPLTLLSPENSLPGLVSFLLFLGWWRLSDARTALLYAMFGWALLHLVAGGVLSVLPLPVWPFVPEQSLAHYLSHAFYSLLQLPLLIWLGKRLWR
jgi:hypothetical protein